MFYSLQWQELIRFGLCIYRTMKIYSSRAENYWNYSKENSSPNIVYVLSSYYSNFRKGRKGECKVIAGSGREENRNNCYPHAAAFAQPSGLSYCDERNSIFIADSESSSVRELNLETGKVTGVAGGNRNPSVSISKRDFSKLKKLVHFNQTRPNQ